jgi:flagellar FliJ protein
MSKRAKRLEPVKMLRQKQLNDEARKVATAASAYQSALAQLNELENYLREYYADPNRGTITFQSAQDLVRYQQFVVKLNEAIVRQRQFVSLKDMGLKGAQRKWLDAKAKVDAIDKLMAKARQEDERREAKLDQKRSDEFAARLFRTRSHE